MFLLTSFLNAQIPDLVDSKKFHDQTLGGECLVKSSKIDVDGEISMKIFEIEVAEEGDYYLSAWMMNTRIIEKNNGLQFYIDDERKSSGKLKPLKESWQSVQLLENNATKSKKLKLASGRHTVTFCSTIPEIPPVEFIRIARTEPDSRIPDDNWINYFEAAKNNTLNQPGDIQEGSTLSKVEDDPRYKYEYEHNTYFTYTYFTYLY